MQDNMSWRARLKRHVLAPTYDLLRGTQTMRCLSELEKSQWWPQERIRELQSERLQRLIHHAYEHVPYYRNLMDASGVLPSSVRTAADLSVLPVLTKADVREHIDDLLADDFPRSQLLEVHTGGSTGEPLCFYSSRESVASHGVARTLRALEGAGIRVGDRTVTVTERTHSSAAWATPFRDIVRLLSGRYIVDFASLSDSSLPFLVERIAGLHPRGLTGFPSALCIIAEFIRDSGIPAPDIHTIVTGGEALFDEQRPMLRDIFGTEPFSNYSSFENYSIAHECEAHAGMHVAAEDLVVEIVDSMGRPVGPGRQGRIVITNLHEYGMPLIRYDTDDESSFLEEPCICGRSLPRLSPVIGRSGDNIYTPSGRRLSARSFRVHHLATLGVRRFQVVQDKIDHVIVRVVPNALLSMSSATELATAVGAHFGSTLGDDVDVQVDVVERIEPTPAGKHLFFISKIERPRVQRVS